MVTIWSAGADVAGGASVVGGGAVVAGGVTSTEVDVVPVGAAVVAGGGVLGGWVVGATGASVAGVAVEDEVDAGSSEPPQADATSTTEMASAAARIDGWELPLATSRTAAHLSTTRP